MNKFILIQGNQIEILPKKFEDYISLTDIARYKNKDEPKDIVKNWLRNKNTIEFLGLWERINNPKFKGVEFDPFLKEAGSNYFVLSPQKWIIKTNAIGLISKSGRNGGTFAHKDIALEFASWISSEFKLYLIKEIQRLKSEEYKKSKLEWSVKRELAKINYKIHTNSIKENLIPQEIPKITTKKIYADEADVLNKALFGITAKEWSKANPSKKGNLRDYAKVIQLVILANLEVINSELIKNQIPQNKRLLKLNKIAISQMQLLLNNKNIEKLGQINTIIF
jgi:hypothetical protein